MATLTKKKTKKNPKTKFWTFLFHI